MWSTLVLVLVIASAVLAGEKPCTVHDSDNKYYDLNPLRASKDYQFKTDAGHSVYLNLCGAVKTKTWNIGLDESEGDIAGFVRRDHGDFAIGLVNTTLEVKDRGIMLRQTGGSPCEGIEGERGGAGILFLCDTSVYSAGKPVLLDQWPSEEDKACHFEFEWRTHYACPVGERGFIGGLFVFLTISVIIIFMGFIVISTVYNRFVLRLTGFNQLPKFTLAHAREIWDVSVEFVHAVIDYVAAAWNTRRSSFRNINPTSHHWTSRDEEEALRASDPLGPEPEPEQADDAVHES